MAQIKKTRDELIQESIEEIMSHIDVKGGTVTLTCEKVVIDQETGDKLSKSHPVTIVARTAKMQIKSMYNYFGYNIKHPTIKFKSQLGVKSETLSGDDLTKIVGIGKAMHKKLHDLGVTTIDQVADLNIGDHGIKEESIYSALELIRK